MDLTRVSKSGSRNWMRYSPTRSIIADKMGSAVRRWSMASCIVKHSRFGVRQLNCTGMRTLLSLAVCATLLAQTKPSEQDMPATIKVDVDIVNVLASVRDKRGGLVGNLEKGDFTILQD